MQIFAKKLIVRLCTLSVSLVFLVLQAAPAGAQTCDYYASPNGTGNGLSQSTPFRIADFWAVAEPGTTLCLLDGEYTGHSSMVRPTIGLKGMPGQPITVRALHDGGARINGQNARPPVQLRSNDYFVIVGIDAHNSSWSVVAINQSSHNIIRRVCGWDAADSNTNIFSISNNSTHNLLEDCAGWGIARKTYQTFSGADYTTLRRCWGRWEGSHVVGPKMTYTLVYNNRNMLIENCIGTWSGERMRESYTLGDYSGGDWLVNDKPVQYSNYEVEQPYGIFAVDAITDEYSADKNLNSSMLGCIAYTLTTGRFDAYGSIFITKVDSFTLADVIAVRPQGGTVRPFFLSTLEAGYGAANLRATRLTSIGGSDDSSINADWVQTNRAHASAIAELGSSPYNGSHGANLCYQYADGHLTSRPLWPWPMNERIRKAMIQSGRAAVDVTRTVEALLGSIPAACGGTGATPPVPPGAPAGLQTD